MSLQQTYLSTGGVSGETDQLNFATFTKELLMGVSGSWAAGSYPETAVSRPIWTCDAPTQLLAVLERHSVVGSTLMTVVKATGSTPLGSAAPVISTTISGVSAVNVYQSGTLYNSTALLQYAVGDQVGVLWSVPGAMPPVGIVTLVLQRL
jgi:hypothetical protein